MVGLNLVEPETAPKVIKPWDERLDEEEFVESGVDDEVSDICSSDDFGSRKSVGCASLRVPRSDVRARRPRRTG